MTSLPLTTIRFLKELSDNNSKDWFQANQLYYKDAKEGFVGFVNVLIDQMQDFVDLGPLEAKDCMYRVNRDLRFSKDKTPYNTHFSALIAQDGKKTDKSFHYIKIKPDGISEISGGFWTGNRKSLDLVRQEIDYNGDEFRSILSDSEFMGHFGRLKGDKLKRPPKGYEAGHPDIEFLKMKYYVASKTIGEPLYGSGDLMGHTIYLFKLMRPFLNFIDRALEEG